MDMADPRVAKQCKAGQYRLVANDWKMVAANRDILKRLGISFSAAALGSLAGFRGENHILATILAIVDLRECKSAQAALQLINRIRPQAQSQIWHTLDFQHPVPREFSLIKLPGRNKHLLDGTFEIIRSAEITPPERGQLVTVKDPPPQK